MAILVSVAERKQAVLLKVTEDYYAKDHHEREHDTNMHGWVVSLVKREVTSLYDFRVVFILKY